MRALEADISLRRIEIIRKEGKHAEEIASTFRRRLRELEISADNVKGTYHIISSVSNCSN